MIRRLAGITAAMAVALGLAVGPAAAQDAPSTTAPAEGEASATGVPVTPSGDPAIDDLVSCVQGSRQLLVLFLIDESASLKVTDPDDRRVDAARGALDSLIALGSSSGAASPDVDVALAAFSNEFRLVQDWTPAGPDTAEELNGALDEFAVFNQGIDTDFVNALTSAREALADQAAEITSGSDEPPCRAIMLFTDGGYDLAVRTSDADRERLGTTKPYAPGVELTSKEQVEEAEALGRKALCDPGQLADRLRADDITMLTVALSGDVARRSQLPLAAATSGIADDYTCGTQPKEGEKSRPKGAYLPAEDIDVLVAQFDAVGTRLAGGSLVPGDNQVTICGNDPCDEGSRTFALDPSLRQARVLALPPKAGAVVVLTAPDGTTATVSKAGRSKLGGTELVTRSVAGRGFAIDLMRPTGGGPWAGRWTATIEDPKQEGDPATLQIYVFSDIEVSFASADALERGAPTTFEVEVDLPKGVKAADVIKTSTATVRLRNPVTGQVVEVPMKGAPGGPFTGTYDTPATLTSNEVDATAEVRITTTGDAVLVSQSAPKELLVRRPKGSIQFSPGSIQMPSLTGAGSTQGDLVLVGGDGPGCVWFGEAAVPSPPDGAGPVKVTLEDGTPLPKEGNCIKVAKGKAVSVTVEASPDGRASGSVSGTLQVFEKVDGREQASTTEVPFRFDMARGVDQARRILLSVLLLLAGLGLPLLVLIIINALTARFQELDAVRGAAVPVQVVGPAISRTGGSFARPLSMRADDFGSLAATGSTRRFTFGGVVFRARASRNPFGATIALAAPEGGAEKLKGGAGSRVELDPSLAGSWVFLLDPDETRRAGDGKVVGLLLAFIAEGDVAPQFERLDKDISERLPDTAARLAGLVRQSKPKGRKASPAPAPAADPSPATADPGGGDQPPVGDAIPVEVVALGPSVDEPGPDDDTPTIVALGPSVDEPADGEPAAVDADPIGGPIALSAGDPIDVAPPTEATPVDAPPAAAPTADETPADDAPADDAPLGFGGRAAGAVPVTPPPAEDAPDDDGPTPPPVGFTGRGD